MVILMQVEQFAPAAFMEGKVLKSDTFIDECKIQLLFYRSFLQYVTYFRCDQTSFELLVGLLLISLKHPVLIIKPKILRCV